jgi:hypothetical protein
VVHCWSCQLVSKLLLFSSLTIFRYCTILRTTLSSNSSTVSQLGTCQRHIEKFLRALLYFTLLYFTLFPSIHRLVLLRWPCTTHSRRIELLSEELQEKDLQLFHCEQIGSWTAQCSKRKLCN